MDRQPHLPNEIWLSIIAYCDSDKDLWLSLRPTNRQLHACVEQHFLETVLPHLQPSLPMIMPSYDARNPIRGLATFKYHSATDGVVVFELADTGPQFYRENFLGRWKGMQDVDGGRLRESVVWEIRLGERVVRMRMRDVRALRGEEARISFEWKGTLTGFWR